MSIYTVLLLALAIGFVAGLRSVTAPAVVAWAALWDWLNLKDSRLAPLASPAAAYVITALAVAELIADKLPWTPDRRKLPSLIWRLLTGGLSGAALCLSVAESIGMGALLGATGAILGAYIGYEVRHRLVTKMHAPDGVVALVEDCVAIGGAFLIVAQFS